MNADYLISKFGLKPHPEGGHYRETFRPSTEEGGRGDITAIYYLLREGEASAWHRVDAVEIWHFYAGSSLELRISHDAKNVSVNLLGIESEAEPQIVVPAYSWQSAVSKGPWTLAGCTVAPAFEFDGFELAPASWEPGYA
ncbi:MAG: cupin domain-containing protein [Albidovulum sp.]|nr:cupin domain-containing protein [Albidovulum sp.]